MSPRRTSYVVPKPPKGGSKTQRYEIGCQLLIIINRKSVFRLVPTSMTLNDLERCIITLILRFSPNSIALLAKYVIVVECRPIISVNVVWQFQSSIFGHLTNPAALLQSNARSNPTRHGTYSLFSLEPAGT